MTQNTNHTSLRKIELQSPLDLTYLESQARRSARARIDTALPPSAGTAKNAAGEDDVVRRRVEELVSGYIKRTFDGVRRNVCVNGLEFDESADGKEERDPDEEFEPLNTRLADRIRALEAQKEKLTETVADLRREAPGKAAESWREQWKMDIEAMYPAPAQAGAAEIKTEGESAPDGELDIQQPQRWDDVQSAWERGAEGLVGLKSGLTETGGKLDEARRVVGVLDGEQ